MEVIGIVGGVDHDRAVLSIDDRDVAVVLGNAETAQKLSERVYRSDSRIMKFRGKKLPRGLARENLRNNRLDVLERPAGVKDNGQIDCGLADVSEAIEGIPVVAGVAVHRS